MAWYFLGEFSRISDGNPYSFYPRVPPPPGDTSRGCMDRDPSSERKADLLLPYTLIRTFL